jgi:hypothetical protein
LTVIEKDLNPTTRYWLWVQEHFEWAVRTMWQNDVDLDSI